MTATTYVLSTEERATLIAKCLEAKDNAYSPRAHFHVGACLLAEDGSYVTGCNVTCFGVGNSCAEQTAVWKGVSEGHHKFVGLAVSSDVRVGISPCGFCRQILSDFLAPSVTVLLVPASYDAATSPTVTVADCRGGKPLDAVIETTIGELLPLPYGDEDFKAPRL